MKTELDKNNTAVGMAALCNASYPNVTTIHTKTDFPVLLDVSAQNAWSKHGVPGKEHVWVYDKNGKLVAFYKPWQINLGSQGNYDKLKSLLTSLAK